MTNSNFIYNSAKQKFLNGEISWQNDEIRVALIQNELYVGDNSAQANHKSLADINSSAILRVSHPLQNKTSDAGAAYAAAVVFNEVPAANITSVIVFKQGITPLQSYLIAHMQVWLQNTSVQDVTIQWNSTGNKIFRL